MYVGMLFGGRLKADSWVKFGMLAVLWSPGSGRRFEAGWRWGWGEVGLLVLMFEVEFWEVLVLFSDSFLKY